MKKLLFAACAVSTICAFADTDASSIVCAAAEAEAAAAPQAVPEDVVVAPAVEVVPEAVVQPEPMVEPEAEAVAAPQAVPEDVVVAPAVEVAPETVVQPEPVVEPEAEAVAAPQAVPEEVVVAPTVEVVPEAVVQPEPVVEQEAVVVSDAEEDARDAAAENETPIFWGFGNYGLYSGYQLYGSLVNPEPTLQGYAEINANLVFEDLNLGYLGVGIWSNTDLTDRRRDAYGKAFNEWDPNVHYGFTYWFDDEKRWGLTYRTSVIWYYYPHRRHDHINGSTPTTVDWNHYVELVNPYVIPFVNFVHEYHETDANLIEFGAKKPWAVCEDLFVVPSLTFVWRNSNYGWCFPHFGRDEKFEQIGSGLATMKLMVEATYNITDNFGIFAKVAYCSILDDELRDAAETAHGGEYGKYKDFAWGGVGVCFRF